MCKSVPVSAMGFIIFFNLDSTSNLGNEGAYDDTGFITQMDPQTQQCSLSEKDTNKMEMQKGMDVIKLGGLII